MKSVLIHLEEKEYETLKKDKKDLSWRDYLFKLYYTIKEKKK